MTIESASHPEDLSQWDGKDEDPFYFEVFGETSPVLDVAYAEVIPPGSVDGGAQTTQTTPVYEYWWTIGHPGHRPSTVACSSTSRDRMTCRRAFPIRPPVSTSTSRWEVAGASRSWRPPSST